jgi:choline dehydrogenase-like flavoprotein
LIGHLIIGTGPASVSAGRALISAGIKPTYLDAGELTEGRVITAANRVTSDIKHSEEMSSGYKTWFGSDAPYQKSPNSKIIYSEKVQVRASNAIGGFSRIWGATFEYFSFSDWAEKYRPADQDKDAITRMVRPSLVGIDLPIDTYSLSLTQMRGAHLSNLRTARLSINTAQESESRCILCKLCLEGCPRDSIWFSGKELQEQIDAGKANLISSHYVFRIQKVGRQLKVSSLTTTGIAEIIAQKVYLGAGVIETGAILLQSNLVDGLEIKDNATVFSAGLSLKAGKAPLQDFSLSKVWFDFGKIVKMSGQIYSPSDSNLSRLEAKLPSILRGNRLVARINSRLVPIISYADQDSSGSLTLTKTEDQIVVGIKSPAAIRSISKELGRLTLPFLKKGILFPWFLSDFGTVGIGYHFGSSLPMGVKTNHLGELKNFPNLHVIDASVFPTLETGSITPSIMASAHRIARQANE